MDKLVLNGSLSPQVAQNVYTGGPISPIIDRGTYEMIGMRVDPSTTNDACPTMLTMALLLITD